MPDTFKYTVSQQKAIIKFSEFINSEKGQIFILKGYAGTGKTTLIKEFISRLQNKDKMFSLLASTGRAAKILSNITKVTASTVHSEIYMFNGFNQDIETLANTADPQKIQGGQLLLQFKINAASGDENDTEKIFIIDEASMLSDKEDDDPVQAIYGSGKLLTDLFTYAPQGKFIFVGDYCQLPPVKQRFSPALQSKYLQKLTSMPVIECELTEIVRQAKTNDLILASDKIRKLRDNPNPRNAKWARFPLKGYANIKIHSCTENMVNEYASLIKKHGYNKATFICRSHKSRNELTYKIREQLNMNEKDLHKNELLLITQNNICGLMNGDLVRIISASGRRMSANLTFIEVEVEELVTKKRFSKLLIKESISQNTSNLTKEQQRNLYIGYYNRMKNKGVHPKSAEFKENMLKDEYLNALRAIYGYVLTCHKAQGGEWDIVYLDIPKQLPHRPDNTAYQWLYTAMTRAKQYLLIRNDYYLE
jgi:hypothetical protein